MRHTKILLRTTAALAAFLLGALLGASPAQAAAAPRAIDRHDGFVDANGLMIYYESVGNGPPLVILHGGPGATHDYFLPYLLPLAAHHRMVLIDERGSGRSGRLADAKYTLPDMVSDVEAVRQALSLGKIDLMGHSFGGILAQAYAIAHPDRLRRLILASTGSSAAHIDADFAQIKAKLDPELRRKIETLESNGIFDRNGAQLPEYRKLADEAEAPYSYLRRQPFWDAAGPPMGWDILRELWVTHSDFEVGGYLKGFDFTPQLHQLRVPTLVIYGDHDLVSRATVEETHQALPNGTLVEMANSAHNTFVDDPDRFLRCVSNFLDGLPGTGTPCP